MILSNAAAMPPISMERVTGAPEGAGSMTCPVVVAAPRTFVRQVKDLAGTDSETVQVQSGVPLAWTGPGCPERGVRRSGSSRRGPWASNPARLDVGHDLPAAVRGGVDVDGMLPAGDVVLLWLKSRLAEGLGALVYDAERRRNRDL